MQSQNKNNLAQEPVVKGRVIYLLALIALVQFGHPITAYGTFALVIYELIYTSMIVAGVFVGRNAPRQMLTLAAAGLVFLVASLFYAFNPTSLWARYLTYAALVPYDMMLTWILVRFIFGAGVITRDVLYAAISLYLLLGAVFVPLYGMLELRVPGSFHDASFPDQPVRWQQLAYFSFATLTTGGTGDVLPISAWARSLANFQMVTGVLYLTIILARMVSLYSGERERDSS